MRMALVVFCCSCNNYEHWFTGAMATGDNAKCWGFVGSATKRRWNKHRNEDEVVYLRISYVLFAIYRHFFAPRRYYHNDETAPWCTGEWSSEKPLRVIMWTEKGIDQRALHGCAKDTNIVFTNNRSDYDTAAAILFWPRRIKVDDLPTRRKPYQSYVCWLVSVLAFLLACRSSSGPNHPHTLTCVLAGRNSLIIKADKFYNHSCTYCRRTSSTSR